MNDTISAYNETRSIGKCEKHQESVQYLLKDKIFKEEEAYARLNETYVILQA